MESTQPTIPTKRVRLPMITAEEFDAKFDAGEDISGYMDWDNAVVVQPGEMSPGMKLSLEMEAKAKEEASKNGSANEPQPSLHIALPPWAFDQLQREASRQGIRQEELAQLLIIQRLE